MTIAETQEQRRGVVAEDVGARHEEQVGHTRERYALGGILHEAAFAQGTGSLQARCHQTAGQQQEPSARAAGDAHDILAVDGQIVADDAKAEPEENHVHRQQPATKKEETVPAKQTARASRSHTRSSLPCPTLGPLELDAGIGEHTGTGYEQRQPKEQLEIVGQAININRHRRRYGHGEVVAKAVVANAFVAARRGQDVDGNRGVGHRERTERSAVESPDDGEQQQRRRPQVTPETYKEKEGTGHEHTLARKRIDKKTAERPGKQSRQRIAAKHQAHHILRSVEALNQVQRQQRCQQIKSKEKGKVGRHHAAVIPIPQTFLHNTHNIT